MNVPSLPPPASSEQPGKDHRIARYVTFSLQVLTDLFVLTIAYVLAFLFRFEFDLNLKLAKLFFFTWPYVVLFQYFVLVLLDVPRLAWRYVGIREAARILLAIAASVTVLVLLRLGLASFTGYAKFVRIPLGVLAMDFVLAFLGVAGARVLRRIFAEQQERARRRDATRAKRTLLIGAGRAGVLVAREIEQRPDLGLHVVGFIDDDPVKIGTMIQGARVMGDTSSLDQIAKENKVEQAIITMASATSQTIRAIVSRCERVPVPVKIIPGVYEIIGGKVNLSRIREVTIEDLLGRDAVELDTLGVRSFLSGSSVLITGAGGSIGSELCRQVAQFTPKRIVLLERCENALFAIHIELLERFPEVEFIPTLCDISDRPRLDEIFARFRPDVVFHAAAHKHVPMLEWNPSEAIKNNIFGTKCLADTSDQHGVKAFVLISTDKAVNPTSIMGATKRVAENYVRTLSQGSKTKFVAVRFGNVLGSAGSVVPTFKEQIRRGGPITVTHPEMKRFFMTIPEASQLVLQAGTMGVGGDLFILDMGQPVKIVDLARDLIRLSGFSEDEISIHFSGIRPGEKLVEELTITAECTEKTGHPKILRIVGESPSHADLAVLLESLKRHVGAADSMLSARRLLTALVPELREPDRDAEPATQPSVETLH